MSDGSINASGSSAQQFGDIVGTLMNGHAQPAMLAPRLQEHRAVDFLMSFDLTGRHNLVAIDPLAGPVEGQTFGPGDRIGMAAWIDARNGHMNLYFAVNEPRPDAPHNKLKKHHIGALRYLQVDIDPDDGNPFEAERERLMQHVRGTNAGPIPPTFAIDSGSGIQMFWQLEEKLDPLTWTDEVEDQGRGVVRHFGGDAVQNIDRIMRLPGTINLPNAKKLMRGRVARQSHLLFSGGPRYALNTLATAAPPVSGTIAPTLGGSVARVSSATIENKGRIAEVQAEIKASPFDEATSFDDLPEGLKERFEVACQRHPELTKLWTGEAPPKDTSGSGYRAKLVALLGRIGGFSAVEYAYLARVWPYAVQDGDDPDVKLNSRSMARDWVRVGERADATRHFDQAAVPGQGLTASPVAVAASEPPGVEVARPLKVVPITRKPNVSTIPIRQWLVDPLLPLGDVAQLVGEPAINKSTFALLVAFSVATGEGKYLCGSGNSSPLKLRSSGPVLVYNAEDSHDEMRRRLSALMNRFGIEELRHPIILWSGLDHGEIVIMHREGGGANSPVKRAPGASELEACIKEHRVKLVILDPQVSLSRGLSENDTDDMNALTQELARMAARLRISIQLVHHTSKTTREKAGDMGAGRGAFAQAGKFRSMTTLTHVGKDDAEALGGLPHDFVCLAFAKVSHSRKPNEPLIYRRMSIAVGNGRLNMPTAGDLFSDDPVLMGDYAPVLELIESEVARDRADPTRRHFEVHDRAEKIGQAVAAVMKDRSDVRLTDILSELYDRFRADGISRSKDRSHVTGLITKAIGPGLTDVADGQDVRLSAYQSGVGVKAPWHVAVCHAQQSEMTIGTVVDGSDANDASSGVFA